jgi:type IV pilus assembly protein PilC
MPLLLQMMRVGENSGTLDAILPEMIDYPYELLKKAIATRVGLIAPAMTVCVGLVLCRLFNGTVCSGWRKP